MNEKQKIREQLINLGVNPGDVVMMHSSMKSLGTKLTPSEFLQVLMDLLDDDGTLLLPALTYEGVTSENPVFSALESEPCVGVLPKTFMKMPGVKRSIHPTHSVFAWGKRADELTSRHYIDNTPVGENSPFMLITEMDGKLLFIGDILYSCTYMHGLEEIANAPYVMKKDQVSFTLVDENGKSAEKLYFVHDFEDWEQEYERIRDILSEPYIKTGIVCDAPCTLISAKDLKKAALLEFEKDAYSFVSKKQN
ncbi:MAG: AAC(3) family N-acetyltransferase [Oscillospiraceae bacterium]|jgi:aminoglycoside 3-N-acetyltransferase|nr:AAC(3) family N-acetyltransferase [Oscillospiraceae bacterium]